MGTFLISKRDNGHYKFVFNSKKGKTILTSISYHQKADCEQMVLWFKENVPLFTFTKVRNAAGKYFFRMTKDGLVLANSRKYTTELLMAKGIDEITLWVPKAEILDFSDTDFVFPVLSGE